MAFITGFEEMTRDRGQLHPTQVECLWTVFERDGRRLLQLDTYGSAERQDRGTVSQTLQLDSERARQLMSILRKGFPGIG